MRHRISLSAIGLLLVMPVAAANQGIGDGEVELGLLVTTGNTEEYNVKAGINLMRDWETWRSKMDAAARYSESDDTTTARRYRASGQGDYKLVENRFLLFRGSSDDDRFSGFDYEATVTAGYGTRIWEQGDDSFLDLSAGLGYRYNRLRETSAEDEAVARLSGHLEYELTPTSLLRQELGTEIGLEESTTISISVTSIQADFLPNLALKAALRVEHNSDAPARAASTDTETSFTLLFTF